MSKGSSFERDICKILSRWWTEGKRDDVFWRSSQSGGRATQRTKKGKKTFGSYGDITALDPIGRPLLRMFTIELKRGRSHGSPDDLVDTISDAQRPFERCLMQAINAAEEAGTEWLLICRRDHRVAVAYAEPCVLRKLDGLDGPCVRYDMLVNCPPAQPRRVRFVGMLLQHFLQRIRPENIKKMSL